LSDLTRARFSSVNSCSEKAAPVRTREDDGMPSRYLSVSNPWARGENAMQPSPAVPIKSRRWCLIQRFNIEYDGWWINSGVLRRFKISIASLVCSAE
jgi:hypothetical protein